MPRLFLLILLFIGQSSFGQLDTAFGKPIFWYRTSDPWAFVMGGEGPPFILYNNGKVLFWKGQGYNLTQFSEGEMLKLIDKLNLKDTLFQKSRFYNATYPEPDGEIMATDNPSYTVCIKLDTLVRVSVYGNILSKEYRKRFPSQVLEIHDFILNFDVDKYMKWVPDTVEVMLFDYTQSSEIPIKWPTNWPNPHILDKREHQGYVTTLFLDKKYCRVSPPEDG